MTVTPQWTPAEDDYVQRHYATHTDSEIGDVLGRKGEAVRHRRSQLGYLRSRLPKGSTPQAKANDPTEDQIAAACERIQKTWNDTDANGDW